MVFTDFKHCKLYIPGFLRPYVDKYTIYTKFTWYNNTKYTHTHIYRQIVVVVEYYVNIYRKIEQELNVNTSESKK